MRINKYGLAGKGLFPETLPPCFDGSDFKRAVRGMVPLIRDRRNWKRTSDIINYNGTKHNGSRRYYGAVNPIQYFHVCEFVHEKWSEIDESIGSSPFVVSRPKPAPDSADRPVVIPSLVNLTTEASGKLSYSPIVVRADISQFFPSIYTHSLSWVAHGREAVKDDREANSSDHYFNALDLYIRNCQSGETRGIPVGPDAFRVVAEFFASKLDQEIALKSEGKIIGAARHVDDYFIGVRDESDARFILSLLREVLADYRLQVNDFKTEITSGLVPLNDVWAQKLRSELRGISFDADEDSVRAISLATDLSRKVGSDSPVKIFLRHYDNVSSRRYNFQPFLRDRGWSVLEPYLQRVCFHHSHCLDYVFLIVVKRLASSARLDRPGWVAVCEELIKQHALRGHDHEVLWSFWLLLMLRAEFSPELIEILSRYRSPFVRSLLMVAYTEGRIVRPRIRYGARLNSDGAMWLECLVAASTGYSNAPIGGAFSQEFTHLAGRGLRLIDLDAHLESVRPAVSHAISKTRYGYDSDDNDDGDDDGEVGGGAIDWGDGPF